jgi:hypothetical protein
VQKKGKGGGAMDAFGKKLSERFTVHSFKNGHLLARSFGTLSKADAFQKADGLFFAFFIKTTTFENGTKRLLLKVVNIQEARKVQA